MWKFKDTDMVFTYTENKYRITKNVEAPPPPNPSAFQSPPPYRPLPQMIQHVAGM